MEKHLAFIFHTAGTILFIIGYITGITNLCIAGVIGIVNAIYFKLWDDL